MKPRQPELARRIIAAFTLMALAVATLFSLTITVAVSFTEEHYAATSLNHELDQLIATVAAGQPIHLDEDMQFYRRGPDGQPPLPAWLGPIRPGFKEVYREGMEYHVVARERNGTLYVLVEDQEEFERREDTLYAIVSIALR